MDPSSIAQVITWVLPLVTPGTSAFLESAGDIFGRKFAKSILDFLKSTGRNFENKPASSGGLEEFTPEIIKAAIDKYPKEAEEVTKRLSIALKQLLKKKTRFTMDEIQDNLIQNMGFTKGDFDESTKAKLVNGFVDNVVANDRIPELIQEIMNLKPNLWNDINKAR